MANWRRIPLSPWLLAVLHGLVALWFRARGLRFVENPFGTWDWMWQSIPVQDLLERPWSSLYYLHAQPPGFELWGLAWLRLTGPERFPFPMQYGYIALGGIAAVLTWRLAFALGRSRRLAWIAGLGMALNPAVFLYEGYTLYEPLVLAMVTGSAACFWRIYQNAEQDRPAVARRWLAVLIVVLNALVLTRSFYHLVFLAGALGCAWPVWRRMRPARVFVWVTLALMLPTAWYAKNAALYGFFGPSSWYGLGLYKCMNEGVRFQELARLNREGVVPDFFLWRYPYQHNISAYRRYGFDKTSAVPLLSRDDLHNINVPDISRQSAAVAVQVILRRPLDYLAAVHDAYGRFCAPPASFGHLWMNRKPIPWADFVDQALYGQFLTDQLAMYTHIELGSLFYFVFPVLLIFAMAWAARRWRCGEGRRDTDGADERARAWLMAYLLYVLFYVVAIGTLMEYGENMRFRFATEPFTLTIALLALRAAWRRWGGRAVAWLRPDPASFRKLLGR